MCHQKIPVFFLPLRAKLKFDTQINQILIGVLAMTALLAATLLGTDHRQHLLGLPGQAHQRAQIPLQDVDPLPLDLDHPLVPLVLLAVSLGHLPPEAHVLGPFGAMMGHDSVQYHRKAGQSSKGHVPLLWSWLRQGNHRRRLGRWLGCQGLGDDLVDDRISGVLRCQFHFGGWFLYRQLHRLLLQILYLLGVQIVGHCQVPHKGFQFWKYFVLSCLRLDILWGLWPRGGERWCSKPASIEKYNTSLPQGARNIVLLFLALYYPCHAHNLYKTSLSLLIINLIGISIFCQWP